MWSGFMCIGGMEFVGADGVVVDVVCLGFIGPAWSAFNAACWAGVMDGGVRRCCCRCVSVGVYDGK